ncbi:increased DNA methylation 1 isoform X1 [Daucus carota subsp. sativus]|uniref:increased DNA methylation 1 isoform X1 n=1 Tax=Daucus carota subsp. sativus TaxID=79200 RepID=UPI0007F042A8|nr:PREDICTED: increased DNA methylation 1-like isoform X1 [Daucus carota subsp. sativus]XP_017230496.1 PREDICTED: increased DNA methylation 1-like isoform X1 [Daucus carota subsp. sativus]
MSARPKRSNHCTASSSSISCTSNGSGGGLVANEPPLEVSAVRVRRGRPPKRRHDEKDEKKTILSWIIDCGTVKENAEVSCVDAGHLTLKVGKITKAGIICDCCNQVLSAEKFQYHAAGVVDRPYERIIVPDTNRALICCMFIAWHLPSEIARHKDNLIEGFGNYTDTFDDACMICADGGELICCDNEKCHSTNHYRCMDMEDVPDTWFCPCCVCKFCGNPAREKECLSTCFQCEKKYHHECHQDKNPIHINMNSTFIRSDHTVTFCEQSCKEIYDKLKKMVGVSYKLDDSYTWTLIRRMDKGDNAAGPMDYYTRTECYSKLAIVLSLMKQSFEPITDRHTKIDVIQSIVYNCGSNYTRLNFTRFYTVVLEKDGEIISAASLRIHGTKLAEMPFIATNAIHRRKGMCRKLMSAIEAVLHSLNVGYLIIPSVRRKAKTWEEGYNFSRLTGEMKKHIMYYNTLTFHDSIRLQKAITPPDYVRVAREALANVRSQSVILPSAAREAGINAESGSVILALPATNAGTNAGSPSVILPSAAREAGTNGGIRSFIIPSATREAGTSSGSQSVIIPSAATTREAGTNAGRPVRLFGIDLI